MIKTFACAAALATTLLAIPASAAQLQLGVLDCTIEGGTAYVVASNKASPAPSVRTMAAGRKSTPASSPSWASISA